MLASIEVVFDTMQQQDKIKRLTIMKSAPKRGEDNLSSF